MKTVQKDRIVYSINVNDIQEVADQVLERGLTKDEIVLVEESIGDYIDWFQAIENSIIEHIICAAKKIKR
jgi:hypothetical protein